MYIPSFLKRSWSSIRHFGLLKVAIGSVIFITLAGGLYVFSIIRSLPSPELLQNRQVAESTKIFDRSGDVLLYELYDEEKRTIVPFAEIPDFVKWATVALEDDKFYEHGAIDIFGILRAFIINIKSGEIVQGGSTITQQLAKKAFLSDERTYTRKIKELFLSFRLEKNFTKDQILELYLNQIPYGSNAYGIEAASQTFFQKSALTLTLPEAALLASLPQAPSYYSPWGTHIEDLLKRQHLALTRMAQQGYITEDEAEAAKKVELEFSKPANLVSAPHFVIGVQAYLNEKYGEDFVRQAGLRVITTLDANLQGLAEEAVRLGAERNEELYNGKNAALMAQDAKTGQILALVGSRDYFNEEIDGAFNVVTQGLRQPGSALKPFVYLAALKEGFTPDSVFFDVKTEFDTTNDPVKSYQPHNFDELFRGPISLRDSLAQSINIPAVKALYIAGIDDVLQLLRSFGITTLTERSRYGLSLVLGGGEVHLSELVGAYSVLAQDGNKHKQSMILKITDAKGNTLEEFRDESAQVIESQYVRQINDVLTDINARSPLFSASLNQTIFPGHEVAIKTGTTNDYRDAWAVGYTPSLVVGVWAGNSDNQPMERRGGSILAAIPILNSFLTGGLKTQTVEYFPRPELVLRTKPILNGEYVATYQSGSRTYQHIHNELHYLSRLDVLGPEPTRPENDSQYENWEKGVIEWASLNIPNFHTYNEALPVDAALAESEVDNSVGAINFVSPKNGSFIGSNITVQADIVMPKTIASVSVLFNNSLLQTQKGVFESNSVFFSENFSINKLELQNVLKIVIEDVENNRSEKEIILYR